MLSNMILIPQGKRSSKCWKPTFYDSIQLIQPNLYATIGFTSLDIENEIAGKLKTKFKLAEEDVNQILLDFSTFSLPVKINKQLIVVQDDPDDNKFIECALECKANYIISGDTHLLNLKEYEGIKIIKSSEFLKVFYKQES